MNSKFPSIVLSALMLTAAVSVQAQLIGSESFATPTGYIAGLSFGNTTAVPPQNRGNTVGTTGFSSGRLWQRNTANITPVAGGLTHTLVAGTTTAGQARVQAPSGETGARSSYRELAADPTGTTFYMSGLVSLGGNLTNLKADQLTAMGVAPFSGGATSFENEFATGFALGLSRGSDTDVYLSAFAGGQTYTLGDALTLEQASGTQMIVLKLEIGAGATDTLTGWYSLSGSTELIQAFSLTGLDIADSGAQLDGFGLVGMPTNPATVGLGNVALDEWRFGKSLDAVVAVPEPATVALIGLGAMLACFFRKRRTA